MATSAEINAKIIQFIADTELAHLIIHGGVNTVVATDGGNVRSLANIISQLDADVNAAADAVLEQVLTARDTAVASAGSATSSANLAQSSRTEAASSASAAATSASAASGSATAAQASQLSASQSLTAISTLTTQASSSQTAAAQSATTASTAAGTATTANAEAQAARTAAVNSAQAAANSQTAAANSATAASGSATTSNTRANAADASATAAAGSATTAGTHATNAANSSTAAAASATTAQTSASVAVNAPGTSATSATALAIGLGAKALTLGQADKAFMVGQWVYLVDSAAPSTRWMHGTITAFTPGSGEMTVNATRFGGAGTPASWLVMPGSPTYDSLTVLGDGSVSMPGGASLGAPLTITSASPSINLVDSDASMADFQLRANDNHLYLLADRDSNGATEAPIPLDVDLAGSQALLFGGRIWTASNDGAGSGLDADLLRGYGLSSAGARWNTIPFVALDGTMEVGKYIDFHGTANDASDYAARIFLPESNGRGSFVVGGAVGNWAGFKFASSTGAREFLVSTTNSDSGLFNGTSWDWRYDTAAGNLMVGNSSGVWHANNLPFQESGGNLALGGAAGTAKLELTVANSAMAMRLNGGSGRMRFRPYVDATLGAVLDSVGTSEAGYVPLTLIGSTARLIGNSGYGLTVGSTGTVSIGVAPLAGVPLMVNTATGRNVGVIDQASMATLGGFNDSGASAALRMVGNTLVFSGNGSTEAMRVDASQHLIINRTSNSGLGHLQVAGNIDIAPASGNVSAYVRAPAGGNSSVEVSGNGIGAGLGLSVVYGTNNDAYFYNRQAGPVSIGTSNTTRIHIAAGGEVSIGGSPLAGYLLDVQGQMSVRRGAGLPTYLEMAGNGNTIGSASMVYGQDGAGSGYVWNRANAPVLFGANSITHMTLSTNGTLSPATNASQNFGAPTFRWNTLFASELSLSGGIPTIGGYSSPYGCIRMTPHMHLNSYDGYAIIINLDNGNSGGSGALTLRVGNGVGGDAMTVTYGGVVTATNFAASSDERTKHEWRDLAADFVERMADVKHGTFERINVEDVRSVGVSAQSLRDVLPEAVLGNAEGMLSVDYGGAALALSVQLAKRVIEQAKVSAALERRLAKLESA